MTSDFNFSAKHLAVRDFVRNLVQTLALKDRATYYDRMGLVPKDVYVELGKYELPGGGSLLTPTVPKEYLGAGADSITAGIITEEIGRADGVFLTYLFEAIGNLLVKYAPEHIKSKWVPKMSRGESIIAIALTERGAGSDPSLMQTKAIYKNGKYILTGQKHFITHAAPGVADAFLVFAKTGEGRHDISCFFVESNTPGVTQYRIANSLGHRAAGWGGIIFNNVEVSKDNLIGEENKALPMFLDIWNYDRVLLALLSLGMAEASLEEAINYSKQRIVFGQRLADLQHIQFLIAEDYTLIESAKLLAYKALQMRDQGLPIAKEAAMAKWYAIDVAQKVVDDAIQIHGAIGYTEELPLERRYREIRGFRIAAGSSEIMKRTIAREILK